MSICTFLAFETRYGELRFPESVAGLCREVNGKSPKKTIPEEKKNSYFVFTWLLFCFVSLKNWLIFVEGQFLHLENEEKASLSLLRGCPQQVSKEALGPGLEPWLTAALTLTGDKRLPRKEASWLYLEPGVPRFPLLCLLESLLFLKTQLRYHLLQEVFWSLSVSASPSLPPSPGSLSAEFLSLQLGSLSHYIAGPSSTSLHWAVSAHCRGIMPVPRRRQGGGRSQPVSARPAQCPHLSLLQGAWAAWVGVLYLFEPSFGT